MFKIIINKNGLFYNLRRSASTLYCGITKNLIPRLAQHSTEKGAIYTRSKSLAELIGQISKMTKSVAYKWKKRIKRMPSKKNLASE